MDAREAWSIIDQRRVALADLLVGLDEAEWNLSSLCPGWTIREVVGHLTLQQLKAGMVTRVAHTLAGVRGSADERIAEAARRTAVRPVGALIADLRGMSTRTHRGGQRTWPYVLLEVLVHGEDIVRPLGRRLPMSVVAARESADRCWASRSLDRTRFAGVRLTADDTDWQVGDGSRVNGSMADLLLLLTGRAVVLTDLSGPGLEQLSARLG